MARIMKTKGIESTSKRHIPDGVICYSTAIRPFLVFLDEWRAKNHTQCEL